jgi:hypothetical protein
MRTLVVVAALVVGMSSAAAQDGSVSNTYVEPDGPTGQIAVRLLARASRSPNATVALVGYAADMKVTVATAATKDGHAIFKNLDDTGATAYFVLAQFPRKATADRLVSTAIQLSDQTGARVTLTTEPADSKQPVLDDVAAAGTAQTPAKNKVHVTLEGAADPNTPVEIIDAASGKVVAKGTVATKDVTIDLKARAGQVFYAEAKTKYDRYRSVPFQVVADRGAPIALYVYPRLLPRFLLRGFVDDHSILFSGSVSVSNNSWIPYLGADGKGTTLTLPRGAQNVKLGDDSKRLATVLQDGSIHIARALAPGDLDIELQFELPAKKNEVTWSHDLPLGTFKSALEIEAEPGLVMPTSVGDHDKVNLNGIEYEVLKDVTVTPKSSLSFTIKLPKPAAANALLHACRRITPNSASALLGKPFDFTLPTIDGTKLSLAKARKGGPALVLMTAPWVGHAQAEPGQLAQLAKKLPAVTAVIVFSETGTKEILAATGGKLERVHMFVDAPKVPGGDYRETSIGAVTLDIGVSLLPESVFVDRKGIIRAHFVNTRDWSDPAAVRCIKALAAQK